MITTANEILLWDADRGLHKIEHLLQVDSLPFWLVFHPTKPKQLFIFYEDFEVGENRYELTRRRIYAQGMFQEGFGKKGLICHNLPDIEYG